MRKEYTPIAMRCNQEQFDRIKPKLKNVEFNSVSVNHFKRYPYLINCDGYEIAIISNIDDDGFQHVWDKKPIKYETWNEQIFLEACGIKTEKPMKLSKEFIKANADKTLKEVFPSLFVVDVKTGIWYKHTSGGFVFIKSISGNTATTYGFYNDMKWHDDDDFSLDVLEHGKLLEATNEEVFEALKNEAVKRGYENGNYKCLSLPKKTHKVEDNFHFNIIENKLFHGKSPIDANNVVFENGKWAEIIPIKEMTQSQIENELGYKIKIV